MHWRPFILGLVLPASALGGFAACSSGDAPLATVDPEAVPADPSFEQAFGILQRECAPCHDSGGTDPPLDTCEDVLDNLGGIAAETLEKNSMPPGAWPRLTSEERLLLTRWIARGADAPCDD